MTEEAKVIEMGGADEAEKRPRRRNKLNDDDVILWQVVSDDLYGIEQKIESLLVLTEEHPECAGMGMLAAFLNGTKKRIESINKFHDQKLDEYNSAHAEEIAELEARLAKLKGKG
jgi:trehalose-6-phosphate synthase